MRFTVRQILIAMAVYGVLFATFSSLLTDGTWIARLLLIGCILATPFLLSSVIIAVKTGPRTPLAVFYIFSCGVLLVVAAPEVQRRREHGTLAPTCRYCLLSLGLAMHNYHDEHGCFPPVVINDKQGRPMHSWRALLAPYCGHTEVLKDYDFRAPWNGGVNKRLLGTYVDVYKCCYCDENQSGNQTTAVAVTGNAAVFSAKNPTTIEMVKDADTICFIGITASGINCLEPRDLTVDDLVDDAGHWLVSSEHGDGIWICRADGSVRFLKNSCTKRELQALLTISGGESVGEHVYGEQTRGDHWLARAREDRKLTRWFIVAIYFVIGIGVLFARCWERTFSPQVSWHRAKNERFPR